MRNQPNEKSAFRFGVMTIGIITIITFVTIIIIMFLTHRATQDEIEQARMRAEAKTHDAYYVVTGVNEKSRSAFPLALEKETDRRSFQTFAPCTPDQRKLKPGDKVRFELSPIWLGEHIEHEDVNPNCYLRVIKVE